MPRIPDDFRWLFWETRFDDLDPAADANYILADEPSKTEAGRAVVCKRAEMVGHD